METAYLKASDNGRLPANARQIMYAARPHIQKVTGNELVSNYFTQTLLPDYLQETGVTWNVVYDARGHFKEPHTRTSFGLGTLEVRNYLAGCREPFVVDAGISQAQVKTCGPSGNFGAALFIEKEGFDPLLEAANIAKEFDLAIMSTKGVSVTAARELADKMCAKYNIPLLTLTDFDKTGFTIAGTIQRDTRRYEFRNSITTINLGLSLEDVKAMSLESEYQHYPKADKAVLIANLHENGASEEEIAFMFRDFDRLRSIRRVELNAMTSPQFIAFVKRKLHEHGIGKIIPDQDLLAKTYASREKGRRFQEAAKRIAATMPRMEKSRAPKDLQRRVRKYLKEHPEKRWDDAVSAIVAERVR